MGVVIHDDIFEAMEQIKTEKARGEFMVAVVRYGFTREEPKGSPSWLPTFTVLKKRIKLSSTRSTNGGKGGKATAAKKEANGGNATDEPPSKTQANTDFAPQANGEQNADLLSRGEDEGEVWDEVEGGLSPMDAPFGLLCLKALNDVLGTCYATLPSKSALCLSRMEGRYEPDEVRRMVEFKRDEWQGTKFANNLTPNTLFGPDHFEQYMHLSRSHAAEKSENDIYD